MGLGPKLSVFALPGQMAMVKGHGAPGNAYRRTGMPNAKPPMAFLQCAAGNTHRAVQRPTFKPHLRASQVVGERAFAVPKNRSILELAERERRPVGVPNESIFADSEALRVAGTIPGLIESE